MRRHPTLPAPATPDRAPAQERPWNAVDRRFVDFLANADAKVDHRRHR